MISTVELSELPESLQKIPSPPGRLYVRSATADTLGTILERKRVAIVGTRKVTPYGYDITYKLAKELAAHGVVIVSGLAIGVDAIAHRAALDADGLCLAVLPSPVQRVLPAGHSWLADAIVAKKGVIVSEYADSAEIYKPNFVARNRIVTGLSDILVITEATERSGTLHTARFAMKQGRKVLVVPGDIKSPTSAGTNYLLKKGATAVTETKDILQALNIAKRSYHKHAMRRAVGDTAEEQLLIDLIEQGINQGTKLLERSGLPISQFNHHLTMLEITAKIRQLGGDTWALA